jgi:hypothetical protein
VGRYLDPRLVVGIEISLGRGAAEDIDLGRIQTDSNSDQTVPRLPTHQELALRPLYVIAGSAGLVIGWIELY